MKTRLAVFLAAFFLTLTLSALNWPYRQTADEHTDALEKLAAFAKAYPAESERIVAFLEDDKKNASEPSSVWMRKLLAFSREMLDRYPVAPENDIPRLYTLHILDHVTHATQKDTKPSDASEWNAMMTEYALSSLEKVVSEVEKTSVPEGKLAVWKIYNVAFIVKSAHHTIGFDVHTISAWRAPDETRAAFARLAGLLDMAFVSHLHSDHTNRLFLDEMKKAGKTVLIPEKMQWVSKESAAIKGPLPVVHYGKYDKADDFNGILVRSLPGHQDKLKDSLFAVTLDGLTVLHCGDNSNAKMLDLMPGLGRIDLVLTTCWILTPAVQQTAALFNKGESQVPQMCVTGHENELGHRVMNRESFMETFQHLRYRERLMPTVVMSYGENVCYPSGLAIGKGGLESTALAKAMPLPDYPWKRSATSSIELGREYVFTDVNGKPAANAPRAVLTGDVKDGELTIKMVLPDDNIVANALHTDSPVYEDDAVEILIGSLDRADYYHIAVNAKGVVYDSRNGDAGWNGKYTVKTSIAQDGGSWTLDMTIPLEQLDAAGARKMNICVLDKPSGKAFNLIPSGGDFHDADGFGEMVSGK